MRKGHHFNIVFFTVLMVTGLFIGAYGCQPESDPQTSYPEPPSPTLLDEPGEFMVATLDSKFENDFGKYNVTIYYPEDDSSQYPAVAFSPGLGANKNMYKWVGNHLASHGYTVLIFTLPRPFTIKTVQQEAGFASAFELLDAENQHPDSPLSGLVDLSKRAIMGHSMGGVSSLAAAINLEVDAVVSLAPAPGIETDGPIAITAPTQIQTGTLDRICGDKLPKTYYDNLTAETKQFINVNGGNHIQYNDNNSIPGAKRYAAVDTVDYLQRLSRRYATAWLDYFLKGDSSAEPYLFGEYAQQDLQSKHLAALDVVRPN